MKLELSLQIIHPYSNTIKLLHNPIKGVQNKRNNTLTSKLHFQLDDLGRAFVLGVKFVVDSLLFPRYTLQSRRAYLHVASTAALWPFCHINNSLLVCI